LIKYKAIPSSAYTTGVAYASHQSCKTNQFRTLVCVPETACKYFKPFKPLTVSHTEWRTNCDLYSIFGSNGISCPQYTYCSLYKTSVNLKDILKNNYTGVTVSFSNIYYQPQ